MFAAVICKIVWNVFIRDEMAHQRFFVCEVALFFRANLANLRRRARSRGVGGSRRIRLRISRRCERSGGMRRVSGWERREERGGELVTAPQQNFCSTVIGISTWWIGNRKLPANPLGQGFRDLDVPRHSLDMTGLGVLPKRMFLAFPTNHTTVASKAPEQRLRASSDHDKLLLGFGRKGTQRLLSPML